MINTDRAEVRRTVLSRLLSQPAVAHYASTWRLSVEEARAALSSRVTELYLMTPRGPVWLEGGRVLVDLLLLGEVVEIRNLSELNDLSRNFMLGKEVPNLALRHYLGHLLGWARYLDEEVLPGGEVAKTSHLLNQELGWTIGLTRPVVGSLLPEWDYIQADLGYLIRWLHLVGYLSTPVTNARLSTLYGELDWVVQLDNKLYKVLIGEWTLTPHQAVAQALGQHLQANKPDLKAVRPDLLTPPVLHDEVEQADLDALRDAWHLVMRRCSCGGHLGSQLTHCTRLEPDELRTREALEYFYRQRDNIEIREKHDQPTGDQAGR